MDAYVVDFQAIDQTQVALVGGKGALLGELTTLEGICVPDGFCVTTAAFRRILREAPALDELLDRLVRVRSEDREAIATQAAAIRRMLESTAIPEDLSSAITRRLTRFGDHAAFAVRSSATAEDLPALSFAGQHDSYLNVSGAAAILQHVGRCWASLFTERAVAYRLRNGFDHRGVQMAVVVQQMVSPQAAGVLFTADPVSSNRRVAAVEASFGLGDALVSGHVSADRYRVRDGEVTAEFIATDRPTLTEAQVRRLVQLGRQIEAHFGQPQDIEWCLLDDIFQIVQTRSITTLFPLPAGGEQNRVYLSVGHQQMMTDPMKPLGLSLFQLTALPQMHEAGGRLFVDAAPRLASPASRDALLEVIGRSDPLTADALQNILDRGDFIPSLPDEDLAEAPAVAAPEPIEADPAIVAKLIERNRASIAACKRDIQTRSGPALIEFILADIQELKRVVFAPDSRQATMAGMEAAWWLDDQLEAWLGETNVADTLAQSVPGNVTSEMGLALLDVADAIRPHPSVVTFLEQVESEDFLDELARLRGGRQARDAIQAYLGKYGMRCVGEIDITRPRWSERPTALIPMILANIRNFEPGAGRRRFEHGRRQAADKERELLERLRALSDGEQKAAEAKRMIDRLRAFSGYREYPKYAIVSRYFVYKQALLREAEPLVQAHVLREKGDIFYLTVQELRDALRPNQVDDELIDRRRDAFRSYQALTPPRVMTSDGEVIEGTYRREHVPEGALAGVAVSTGTAEGRARVILDIAEAELGADDILVTTHTDPSWAPAFVAVKGLVTEVGGRMTHGAVIAREYGLPAVVGVERATQVIRDGQRIRIHGTYGYVEILDDDAPSLPASDVRAESPLLSKLASSGEVCA